ncbi:hypothetical protein [Paraburkholderia strydomiana]|uniref:hypothetical protein n=1 Tax=Paraburkholderia strydomiana TaxID=1245417 RepID=UPI0038BC212F
MNDDLNQAVAFAQRLHSAIVKVEEEAEPVVKGIEMVFGAITGVWPRPTLNGAVPFVRDFWRWFRGGTPNGIYLDLTYRLIKNSQSALKAR